MCIKLSDRFYMKILSQSQTILFESKFLCWSDEKVMICIFGSDFEKTAVLSGLIVCLEN